jgi:hypothetical protein
MRSLRGTKFDPEILDVFLGSLDEVLEVKALYGTPSSFDSTLSSVAQATG